MIKVYGAYRTVSTASLQIIADDIPINLKIDEVLLKKDRKGGRGF